MDSDASSFDPAGSSASFVNYVEGIYVGYKFYETAAEEGLINYDDVVQYPFGYGLSYTSFKQEMGPISESNGTIAFEVTVTNTGSVAGKDVVEVYVNPPYTDGGIEKASANLIAFDKTGMLEPGASETVAISFQLEDLASYDMSGKGRYLLEAGDYVISVNHDSHTVLDSETYTVSSAVDYSSGRSSDQTAAVNQFDFAEGDVTYLSRAGGFANYAAATAAPASYEMSDEATAADEDPNAQPLTTGAKNGLQLKDLRGLDYDDPKWDQLLDQMTLDDMNDLISLGGYQTNSVSSIGKVRTNDNDGPASINNNFTGVGSVGFPAGVMIAATWSKDLALSFGESIGKMADEMNTSGWYAPAMNIHRTAFAGRNFEHFAEDGLLSGAIAANAVAGAKNHGVYSYMKHFALNDQEGNRNSMLCTWSNEQAIREIYLKPFEMCVKDAGCEAAMSSFNYIGNRWAGGCAQLLNNVLRDEWGFDGFVVSDWGGSNEHIEGVRAGSHLEMPTTRGDSDLELVQAVKDGTIGEFAQSARYQGAGSSVVNATKVDNTMDIIGDYPLNVVGFAPGYPRSGKGDPAMQARAVELAKQADVVLLYIGLDEISESEGLDRPHMRLPQSQTSLLQAVSAVNPNIVAVMSAGSAVEMPWLDQCRAVIHGYLCGQAGAGAMLQAILGEINPSGKLAESYPIQYEDVPSAPYFPAKQRNAEYREGPFVGYRYYETAKIPVLFPFGFGLSYTTFVYSGLTVSESEVVFTLTNTGTADGAEAAQVYVGKEDAQVFRPAKELKGFAKIFLKAGESKTVTIPLDGRAFRYFNVKTNRFEVEGGEYQISSTPSTAFGWRWPASLSLLPFITSAPPF